MQEVFEKIKKNLVTELTFCSGYPNCSEYDYAYEVAMYDARNKATAIVNQVAEEYNNGWIPVEEKLPEEHELYDITFKNDAGIHSDSAIYEPFSGNWYWCDDETELLEGDKVLAWAEKREPYQPKGDKE